MSASDYPQPDTFDPKWVAYFAALFVLLIALAQVRTLSSLVVAFAWLIVIAALMLLINNGLLEKVGLSGKANG